MRGGRRSTIVAAAVIAGAVFVLASVVDAVWSRISSPSDLEPAAHLTARQWLGVISITAESAFMVAVAMIVVMWMNDRRGVS